ncbi:Tom7-domain-containing protein [Atractiella rhizophila]|nr:Tom7-domain-containing protein [Atractiella rhizophila]
MVSEDVKDALNKTFDVAKAIVHFGWIPFIIYLRVVRGEKRPTFIQLITLIGNNCAMF